MHVVAALRCQICPEELFHVPIEVDAAVMHFLVAGRAEHPDVVQCIGPAVLDRDNVVDLKVLIVTEFFEGTKAALADFNLKPLGRPFRRYGALPAFVLEVLGFATPAKPGVAGGAVNFVAVDRVAWSLGVWFGDMPAAFAGHDSEICVPD